MEQTCAKCGATLDAGMAFCPHCEAPQIRFNPGGEPGGSDAPVRVPGYQEPQLPAGIQLPGDPQLEPPGAPVSNKAFDWPDALRAAALAGAIAAVLMQIPFGGSILGLVVSGALAVLFYWRSRMSVISGGLGARLGALCGGFTFFFFSCLKALVMALFGGGDQTRAAILAAIDKAIAQSPDPQARAMMEGFKTPAGIALILTFSFAALLVLFVLCSAVGGLLGARMLRRRDH